MELQEMAQVAVDYIRETTGSLVQANLKIAVARTSQETIRDIGIAVACECPTGFRIASCEAMFQGRVYKLL